MDGKFLVVTEASGQVHLMSRDQNRLQPLPPLSAEQALCAEPA